MVGLFAGRKEAAEALFRRTAEAPRGSRGPGGDGAGIDGELEVLVVRGGFRVGGAAAAVSEEGGGYGEGGAGLEDERGEHERRPPETVLMGGEEHRRSGGARGVHLPSDSGVGKSSIADGGALLSAELCGKDGEGTGETFPRPTRDSHVIASIHGGKKIGKGKY